MGHKLNLKGRQGASAKRANGDFPSRGWKIVISQFNHPIEFAGYISPPSSTVAFHRFPPVLYNEPYSLPTGRRRTIGALLVPFHLFYNFQVKLIYVNQGFKGLIWLCLNYSVYRVISTTNLFNLYNLILFIGLI